MINLADPFSDQSPFVAYSYSYPHKTAHRRLDPAVSLTDAWRKEPQDSLFLYAHLPFCGCRCGFCNLFTMANAGTNVVESYLQQVRRQAVAIRDVLPNARFARLAIGGGTPTFLTESHLAGLFDTITDVLGVDLREIPVSCEASPTTMTSRKLTLLVERGVDRISVGVQTFDDRDLTQLGREQHADDAKRSIEIAREAGVSVLNLDLIYGIPGQSIASWITTVQTAARCRPQELYLYPLYVRDATALCHRGVKPSDHRLEEYRIARRILLDQGYRQLSLRMFRALDAPEQVGPVYCCQADGMVGLGCGARSYTRTLHYSSEYAVSRAGVLAILNRYLQRDADSFTCADHGFWLDEEDQRRRFTILGLLLIEGLSLRDYQRHFGTDPFQDLPQLHDLIDCGLASRSSDRLKLTEAGIERSDTIGPWLYSQRVRSLMEAYQCH